MSHCGLICEAQEWFEKMESKFGIHRDVMHYTCMVDVFGRAGRLDDALKLIHEMESLSSSSSQYVNLRPNIVTWTTLLGACRTHVDVKTAEYAAEMVHKLDSMDASAYVLLYNTYSAAGQFDKIQMICEKMKGEGIQRRAGKSMIQINGKMHTFIAHDKSHSSSDQIYNELNAIV